VLEGTGAGEDGHGPTPSSLLTNTQAAQGERLDTNRFQ